MQHKRSHSFRLVFIVMMAVGALLASTVAAQAAPKPYGTSVGNWGGAWWQWAFAQPADADHPLFDETGASCMNGQADKGFIFLAGVFNSSGAATRECDVPVGRGIFVPAINVECSSLEVGTIFYGDDAASLNRCLDAWHYEGELSVDGNARSVWGGRSDVYSIGPMPSPNLLGADPGAEGVSMADGLYGVIPPLPAGHHHVQFSGTASYDGSLGGDPFAFTISMDYHLHVGGR